MPDSSPPRSSSLAQLFLRYAAPLSALRRLPLIGGLAGWASGKLLPRNQLSWAQVQSGPAAGLWLNLNPRTGSAYFAGGGEPAVQSALQQHLLPGKVFYDVGANIGFFSLLAARIVGPQGRVFSFEADPEIAARLRQHLARNNFSWARAEECAVWSAPTTVHFARTDPAKSPDRGLGHVVDAAEPGSIPVPAISLDGFAQANPPPDFLKCDVEGAELAVFLGAQTLLTQKRPGILCEMHSESNRAALLQMFQSHNYACSSLDEQHVLALPN